MAILLKITADDQGRPVIKRLQGDIDKLDKTVERSAKKQVSSLTKLKAVWKQYGYLLTTGAVTGAVLMVRKFADMASAAEETANKFNVIFEGTANLTESIGQMRKETGYAVSSLQEMTSSLGTLIKPVGFSAEKTFDLSKKITQLSLDIGSFMNLRPQDVVMNFQSALDGSSEILQKYGIDARETTLAQEAFNMGLIKSAKQYEKLDPEEKRRVRTLALIEKAFKDTQSAQGDLVRTQDSYANISRTANEKFTEFGEMLGTLLQPKLAAVKKLFGEGAEAATKFLKAIVAKPMEKTAAEKQIEFLEEYVKGYKSQKEIENLKESKVTDLLKSNFDYQVEFNAATNERSKVLLDQLSSQRDSSLLGKEQVTNAGDLFKSEYRVKNIIEEQLGIRNLNLSTIEQTIKKLKELKKEEDQKPDPKTDPVKTANQLYQKKENIRSMDQWILDIQQKAQANLHEMVIDTDKLKQLWDEVKAGTKKDKEAILEVNTTLDQTLNKMAQIVNLSKGKFSLSKLLGIGSVVAGFFSGGATWALNLGGASSLAGALGFQHGGSFVVPGSGSPDSKLVAFKATPGETVTVTKPGQTINNNSNANINFVMNDVNQETIRNIIIPAIRKELSRGELKFA